MSTCHLSIEAPAAYSVPRMGETLQRWFLGAPQLRRHQRGCRVPGLRSRRTIQAGCWGEGGGLSSSYGVYFLMFTPSSFVTSRKQVAKLGCARVTRFEAAQETVGTAKAQSTLIGCAFSIPNRVQNELLLILAGEASHLWSGVWSNGIGQAV